MALLNDKSLNSLVKETKDEHTKMRTLTVSAVFVMCIHLLSISRRQVHVTRLVSFEKLSKDQNVLLTQSSGQNIDCDHHHLFAHDHGCGRLEVAPHTWRWTNDFGILELLLDPTNKSRWFGKGFVDFGELVVCRDYYSSHACHISGLEILVVDFYQASRTRKG
jgi:hypothetical protein